MGGEGGVIASNRKYMRGAGNADHTADHASSNNRDKKANEKQGANEIMTTCYLTKVPLTINASGSIVACPYGRLYQKEAAIEALLRRKAGGEDELGTHIRGMKDLYNVRFYITTGSKRPSCPVTGDELNGRIPSLVLIPGGSDGQPNVISERAIKKLGHEALQTEYGPYDKQIRLAPPSNVLEEIKLKLEAERNSKKKASTSKRKRNKESNDNDSLKHKKNVKPKAKPTAIIAAQTAKSNVSSAVRSNNVLSSLFTSNDGKVSEKEKKDNLFVR